MTRVIRPTEADLRERIRRVEARFPDIATFVDGRCECHALDRFARVYGWHNAHHWSTWENARWLLGEDT